MIPAVFDYHAPLTLDEALALLTQHGDKAKILAGGQSLLPLLKLRLGQAGILIDIGRVPGLEYIKEEGGTLRIGAATRESALERSLSWHFACGARHGRSTRGTPGWRRTPASPPRRQTACTSWRRRSPS